jgi:methanogenic corrinoid protein MtbC1
MSNNARTQAGMGRTVGAPEFGGSNMTGSPMPEFRAPRPHELSGDADLASPEFLAAMLAEGDDDMAAWVLTQALSERPRASVYDTVVRPAMEVVGARWERGEWSVSVEHLASVALSNALSRLRRPTEPESRIGPTAVLAAPEGEQHVAGLACLAQVLEDEGWHVENLGANVPADDLLGFAEAREVDLVALSIGTADRLPALRRTVDALKQSAGPAARLPVIAGGHGIAGLDRPQVGADRLCPTLVDAQEFVRSLNRA